MVFIMKFLLDKLLDA